MGAVLLAITREVPVSINECELTHVDRTPIDVARARAEHAAYEAALIEAGCVVERLPDAPELPDSVFVEDTAVVVDELAVITRPGAESRRPEVASTEAALRRYRPIVRIEAPATIDGGDVLRIGRAVYAGLSERTNEEGIRQLREALAPHGYTVDAVPVSGCLHLKTAVTYAGGNTVVMNPRWIDRRAFAAYEIIEVDPEEPYGANVLLAARTLLCAAEYPRTNARIEAKGLAVRTIAGGELAKAEAALTCCSILLSWTDSPTTS